MKKLIIGRNNACDIIIYDTSDLVSRKQAVLTYSFWGKMVLYDTSNNGTYVNGQKMETGKGLRVTRKDKVNFARITDLDWNDVKDPYRKAKLFTAIGGAVFIILTIFLILWFTQLDKDTSTSQVNTENTIEKGETVTTIKPQVVEEQPKQQSAQRLKKKKGAQVTPKEVVNKEVNEMFPVSY